MELNDKSNLNPDIEKVKTEIRKLNNKERKKMVDRWNELPINKVNNITAYAGTEFKISIWLKIVATLGIIFLIGILAFLGFYGYIIYTDGTLLDSIDLVCGNVTIPACPIQECPSVVCSDCNLNCGDFPNTLRVVIRNES